APDGAVDASRPLPLDPRPRLAVVEAGPDQRPHLNRPAHSLDDPQQLPLRVAAPAPAHGEAVEALRLPARLVEGGNQHQRPVEVRPGGVVGVGRRLDRAVAAPLAVDEPPEDRASVEAGEAAPVDRRRYRDEGGAVAVSDQCVVPDRRVRSHPLPACFHQYPGGSAGRGCRFWGGRGVPVASTKATRSAPSESRIAAALSTVARSSLCTATIASRSETGVMSS